MRKFTIDPNSRVISTLISSYVSGQVTTIYGNAGSGKSTVMMLAAISAAKTGKVIYVDTEKGFNIDRMKQLEGFEEKLVDNIFLISPKDFKEQEETILKVQELCKNEQIKLVIFDSPTNFYRLRLSKDTKNANEMLLLQMQTLVRIARDTNKVVLMTSQVYSDMDSDELNIVGGKPVKNLSKCIIELRKKDDERTARLEKYKFDDENKIHHMLDEVIQFRIKSEGLIP